MAARRPLFALRPQQPAEPALLRPVAELVPEGGFLTPRVDMRVLVHDGGSCPDFLPVVPTDLPTSPPLIQNPHELTLIVSRVAPSARHFQPEFISQAR